MKHAHVVVDGLEIPLIGIPPSATTDSCDGCRLVCHIQYLQWDELAEKLYCPKHFIRGDHIKRPIRAI